MIVAAPCVCRSHRPSGGVQDGTVRDLVERPVTFNYAYSMSCPHCRDTTTVTAAEYYSERNEAHVPCRDCGGDIHFGPAVMALRDPGDSALEDEWVWRVAWYHTSTDPGWPPHVHPLPAAAADLLARTLSAEDARRARHTYENQALHLGTYEAAIESVLRRMCDQDDGGAQFYLYRVALRRDGLGHRAELP